jgi:hypothetical protein
MTDELRGDQVDRMSNRQAEAYAGELGQQVGPAAGNRRTSATAVASSCGY